eukprot:1936375-Alexandrium_andersonii.AAC.1
MPRRAAHATDRVRPKLDGLQQDGEHHALSTSNGLPVSLRVRIHPGAQTREVPRQQAPLLGKQIGLPVALAGPRAARSSSN